MLALASSFDRGVMSGCVFETERPLVTIWNGMTHGQNTHSVPVFVCLFWHTPPRWKSSSRLDGAEAVTRPHLHKDPFHPFFIQPTKNSLPLQTFPEPWSSFRY